MRAVALSYHRGVAFRSSGASGSTTERFLVFFLLVMTSGVLTRPTASSDLSGAIEGSAGSQLFWGLVYIGSLVGLVATSRARLLETSVRSAPLLAALALSLTSVFWSDDPVLSLRRAFGLAGTTALAYYIVLRITLPQFLRLANAALGLLAASSIVFVVALPAIGLMHGEYDGAWRGVFPHKNNLGQIVVLGMMTLVAKPRKGPAIAAAADIALGVLYLVLLIGSQSMTQVLASVAFVLILSGVLAIRIGRRALLPAAWVSFAALLVATCAMFVGYGIGDVAASVGRSSDLTGRTEIWPDIVNAIMKRPWLGHGYKVFWTMFDSPATYMETIHGWRPYHAHNGILELALDEGALGVFVFVLILLQGFRAAIKLALSTRRSSELWPILYMTCFTIFNLTESSIETYNQLNWVLFCVSLLYSIDWWRHALPARVAWSADRSEQLGVIITR